MAIDNSVPTEEVYALKTSTKTLSFAPKVTPVKPDKFKELVDVKILVGLQDFSAGKGDKSIYVFYQMDYKDFKVLYKSVEYGRLTEDMVLTKIWPTVEKDPQSPWFGHHRVFKFTARYVPTDEKGQKRAYQWQFIIANGYGDLANGGNFIANGTYVQTGSVVFNMNRTDLYDRLETIQAFIDRARDIEASKMRPYLEYLNDADRRGSYEKEPQSRPAEKPAPRPAQEDVVPVPTKTVIESDFQTTQSGLTAAKCSVHGKEYLVFFDEVTDEIRGLQRDKRAFNALMYQDGGMTRCAGVQR